MTMTGGGRGHDAALRAGGPAPAGATECGPVAGEAGGAGPRPGPAGGRAGWAGGLRAPPLGLVRALVGAGIALVIALRVALAWADHPLVSIDGAFQTWTALAGYASPGALGRDFQSYLGITLLLVLLPVYLLAGRTLLASTGAAIAGSLIGLAATVHALLRPMRWWSPAERWLLTGLGFALVASHATEDFAALAAPGVSLRPLRWALPFLMLPLVLPLLRRAPAAPGRAGVGLGLLGGVAVLWSNDSGIPAFGALALALGLALRRPAGGRAFDGGALARAAGGFLAGAALAAGAVLLWVTGGDPRPWFAYNFGAVAGDQIWYFGPWTREARVLAPADLWRVYRVEPRFTLAMTSLALCAAVATLRRLRGRGAPAMTAGIAFMALTVLGTALLPQVGGHIGAEYRPGLLLPGLLLPFALWGRRLVPAGRRWRAVFAPPVLAPLAALALVAVIAGLGAKLAARWPARTGAVLVPELGLHVDPEEAAELAAMRRLRAEWEAEGRPADRRMISVYTSALDIVGGARPPTAYGALIHARGAAGRRAFAAALEAGDLPYASTISPAYSGWAEWNVRADWPVFRALFAGYEPVAAGRQQILWRRRAAPPAPLPAECRVVPRADGRAEVEVEVTPQAVPDRPMLADIALTRGPAAGGRGAILVVEEAGGPRPALPRGPAAPKFWNGAPRYGAPPDPALALVLPIGAEGPGRLVLGRMDGGPVPVAGCTARLWPAPDLAGLPPLR